MSAHFHGVGHDVAVPADVPICRHWMDSLCVGEHEPGARHESRRV